MAERTAAGIRAAGGTVGTYVVDLTDVEATTLASTPSGATSARSPSS
jgi:hypothetical protein